MPVRMESSGLSRALFSRVPAGAAALCLSILGGVLILGGLALAPAGVGTGSAAWAHGYAKNGLIIEHPWGRPSPGDAKQGAVYLSVKNKGKADDTLVAVKTSVSQNAELHTTLQDEGVMKMRKVEGGLKIPAGETVKLAPGGLHIMLTDVAGKIEPGAKFPLTLVFEKAGEIEVSVQVEKIAPHGHQDSH